MFLGEFRRCKNTGQGSEELRGIRFSRDTPLTLVSSLNSLSRCCPVSGGDSVGPSCSCSGGGSSSSGRTFYGPEHQIGPNRGETSSNNACIIEQVSFHCVRRFAGRSPNVCRRSVDLESSRNKNDGAATLVGQDFYIYIYRRVVRIFFTPYLGNFRRTTLSEPFLDISSETNLRKSIPAG